MSILAIGLSHRTAPVPLLERAVLDPDAVGKLVDDLMGTEHVAEALALVTCNRVEVYVDVDKFHAGVADVSELLARHAGVALESLTPHLYVHYEERAVQHLFSVACGLDSMVVGESQILGQVRRALRRAQDTGTAGRVLHELGRQAVRVGKRAHAETGIDAAGQSIVSVALAGAERVLGPVAGCRALVVGAGSMSALAAATLRRWGAGEILVANRTHSRAERLADDVGGRAVAFERLGDVLGSCDIVVSCTGSPGVVLTAELVAAGVSQRAGRTQVLLDLALPRDVDLTVHGRPGVAVVDLATLSAAAGGGAELADVEAVRRIVAEEVALFLAWQRAAIVAPTVVALREMAARVVDVELARLSARLPDLDARARAELSQTVRRVVDKVLHAPTVRVKELAEEPGGHTYAAALRELFDLDLEAVEAVTRVERGAAP